jgi:hypothetical protein
MLPLPDTGSIRNSESIAGQVTSITQLATDLSVLEDGVEGLGVGSGGSGLVVLDELSGSEDLSEQAELLLEGVPRGDLVGSCVCAEEIPGVEAGEVLKNSHELVATEGCGHVAQVVRYRGVVDESVSDHDCDGIEYRQVENRWYATVGIYRITIHQ